MVFRKVIHGANDLRIISLPHIRLVLLSRVISGVKALNIRVWELEYFFLLQRVARIVNFNLKKPIYLWVFLVSSFGKLLLERSFLVLEPENFKLLLGKREFTLT